MTNETREAIPPELAALIIFDDDYAEVPIFESVDELARFLIAKEAEREAEAKG